MVKSIDYILDVVIAEYVLYWYVNGKMPTPEEFEAMVKNIKKRYILKC